MMKRVVASGALLTIFATSFSALASSSADLEIEITGMEKISGNLMIAVFDDQDGYSSDQPIATQTKPVTDSASKISFSDLVPGEYAVKVYHDENDNGELDVNALGIPSEPYGFSNNASDPFSAPEWGETKFEVEGSGAIHTIEVD